MTTESARLRKLLDCKGCEANMGCNAAKTCVCSIAEEALDALDESAALITKQADEIARIVGWLINDEGDPNKNEALCDAILAENKKQRDTNHFVAHPYLKLIADAIERGDWE